MRIKRPLVNPISEHQNDEVPTDRKGNYLLLNELKPSFKDHLTDNIHKFKQKAQSVIEKFSVWHRFSFVFPVTFQTIFLLTFLQLTIFGWNSIPPQVPYIYDSLENSWVVISKELFTVIVLVVSIFFLLIYLSIAEIFKKDVQLMKTLLVISTFINIIFSIGILEILLLSLS